MTAQVVVGIDGSQAGLAALDWAADTAAHRGIALRVVHACLWEKTADGLTATDNTRTQPGKLVQSLRHEAHERLTEAVARVELRRPEVQVDGAVLTDPVVPALLDAGRRAGLLVVGSRGHGGFAGLLLGSVALRAAAEAEFPVVVVKDPAPGPDRRRVVLGLDPHRLPGAAGDFALAEAAARSADLEVVHAWGPEIDLSGFSMIMDVGTAQYRAQALLDTAVEVLRRDAPAGVTVTGHTAPTSAGAALASAAQDASLLVTGAQGPRGYLGPTTHTVLHHAPCPVAVVRQPR